MVSSAGYSTTGIFHIFSSHQSGVWSMALLCVSGGSLLATSRYRSVVRNCMAAPKAVEAVPSWEELSLKLGSNPQQGNVRLPNVKRREFGDGSTPMVLFYRDNSSWCPYCERVWIQLEEKRIAYQVEKINMRCYGDKPSWYLDKVPSGLLPAMELNGQLMTESLDIMMALEQVFPDHNPLLPPKGSSEADAVPKLLRLERLVVSKWLSRLRSFWPSKDELEKSLDQVDVALSTFDGPYFLGEKFSLVDAVFAPFLERIAASMPYWTGVQIRNGARWPRLQTWFDAMDARPSYQAVKSDDFTITHTLEPQIGPCKSQPAGEAYRAKINGRDGSWDLPLKPEVTAWGKDDGNGSKEEAARTLVENHEAIVGFALRGLRNDKKYWEAVDVGLRYVAYALVAGFDNVDPSPEKLPKEVAKAAAYLRDRVGVPRDMSYPVARQFRAHLHWLVKSLGSELYHTK